MTWKATVEEAQAAVPEGEYDATVVNVRSMNATHGPIVRVDFLIVDPDGDEHQVSGIASQKLSENTKLGRWVAAILGHMPQVGEDVNDSDLLQKTCRVTIQHKTNNDGQVFANVVQVMANVPF